MICKLNSRALFFLNISLSNNHYSLKASWWFNSVTILSSLFLRPGSVEKMKVQWIFLSLLEMNSLKIDTVWSGRGLDVVHNNTQESCVLHVCESYMESCWQKNMHLVQETMQRLKSFESYFYQVTAGWLGWLDKVTNKQADSST